MSFDMPKEFCCFATPTSFVCLKSSDFLKGKARIFSWTGVSPVVALSQPLTKISEFLLSKSNTYGVIS